MVKNKILIYLSLLILMFSTIYALDFNPRGDIDGKGVYDIKNFASITGITNLSFSGAPATCPSGYAMTYFNGSSSTCVKVVSDTVTAEYDLAESNITNVSNLYFGSTYGNFNETAPNRPLTSSEDKTITVCSSGCDYTTIQEALYEIPLYMRHRYDINISDNIYNEDIIIPSIICSQTHITEGSVTCLSINGNSSDMNGVKIKSIMAMSITGANGLNLQYIQIYDNEPRSDENISLSVYGSNSVLIQYINFTAPVLNAIMGYKSNLNIHSCYFNGSQNRALLAKGGLYNFGDSFGSSGNSGSVISSLIAMDATSLVFLENNSMSYPNLIVNDKGLIYNEDDKNLYGVLYDSLLVGSENTLANSTIYTGTNGYFKIYRNDLQGVYISTDTSYNNILSLGKTNRIGTSDAQSLEFQTNGLTRMEISSDGIYDFKSRTVNNINILDIDSYIKFTPTNKPANVEGRVYYNSSLHKMCYYNSTNWVAMDGTGTCS